MYWLSQCSGFFVSCASVVEHVEVDNYGSLMQKLPWKLELLTYFSRCTECDCSGISHEGAYLPKKVFEEICRYVKALTFGVATFTQVSHNNSAGKNGYPCLFPLPPYWVLKGVLCVKKKNILF